MASSLKLSELPVASDLNSGDVMLVADVTNSVSKKITFGSLNSLLSFENLAGYDTYLAELQTVQDQLDLLRGDGSLVHSLSDMDELIDATRDSISTIRDALTATIDTLRDNIDLDILNINQQYNSFVNRIDAAEEHQIKAGLATGYLYVQEFKGGQS